VDVDDPRAKWHPIDSNALVALSNATSAPGVVYPMGTNQMPSQLQNMPGLVSYFVSGYTTGVPLANGMTLGAEFLAVRTGEGVAKGYVYAVGTGANGMVYFNGPHKDFPAHHFASTSPAPVEMLFGNIPTKK
jgi:hypothetical protein